MLLVRVAMGTPAMQLAPYSNQRRPPPLPENHAVLADSILAECRRTSGNGCLQRYREFVFYDRNLCYIEYVLTLKRL